MEVRRLRRRLSGGGRLGKVGRESVSRVDVLLYGPSALLDKVILSLAMVNTVFYPTVNVYCLRSMKST